MTAALAIPTLTGPVRATIRPPGSKSLTNRALLIAALTDDRVRLTGVLDSVDTRVMIDSLRRLGWELRQDVAAGVVELTGRRGGPPAKDYSLWLENSGTSIRFLTALAALLKHGATVRLDGNARMRERPIQPLVDALRGWGADVACELGGGCPPVIVRGRGLPGGEVSVAGDLSSQYLSALLMVAPRADDDVRIRVQGPLVSRPYIEMTLHIMQDFGARIDEPQPNDFRIAAGGYRGRDYAVEPDASAASYFFAVAAVTGGTVTVEGLGRQSLQGDVRFVDVLEQMGCRAEWSPNAVTLHGGPLAGVDVDMNAISDTAQTLAAIAPFAAGPTRIRGVAHMRHKETDRVSAVVTELRRLGLQVEEHPDGLTIHPGPMHPASIATYDDHRMAMSFAVLGLRQPGVVIEDPGCTSKTYPGFFDDLQRVCGITL